MRAPRHRRDNLKHLAVGKPPVGADLNAIAEKVSYVGSVYHKDLPSFAGALPRPRPDASICPRSFATRRQDIESWLKAAIRQGHFAGLWEGGFPRYVWRREGEVIFEGRLIDGKAGHYKGYPLAPEQSVKGLP
ncbi:MAG TPA: hypothetical protein VH253_01755 [Phycisphaerae bacterium]|nr:hypothetical protein [Phycisphaerae bacterium]